MDCVNITKFADVSSFDAKDDVIHYTYFVENCGTTTLTGIEVTDNRTTVIPTGTIPTSLPPGANFTATASYTVTQDDIDNCTPIINTAWVNATGCVDTSDTSDPISVTNAATSGINITKVADTLGPVSPDQVITYNITVCNTGAKTLYNVQVNDNLTGHYDVGTLAPGQCSGLLTGTHMVTSQDVTNGSVVNLAEANATDGCGDAVDASATVTLRVNTDCCTCAPYPQFTYTKTGTTVQFTDTSTGPLAVQWFWQFGDGQWSFAQNPVHPYSNPGRYTVEMGIKWVDCDGKVSNKWTTVTKTVNV
jgi:hypothetical protein